MGVRCAWQIVVGGESMKTKFRTSAVDSKHVLSECGSGLGRVVKILHRTQKNGRRNVPSPQ